MILIPLQKLPKNGGDWGKLIVAKGFKRLPKVQNIAQSGHTAHLAGKPVPYNLPLLHIAANQSHIIGQW